MTDLAAALAQALKNQAKIPPDAPKMTPPPPEPSPPAAYRALLAASDGLVREIAELHGPKPYHVRPDGSVSWWECKGCEFGGYDGEPPEWPCETTGLIAQHAGIILRDDAYVVDGATS